MVLPTCFWYIVIRLGYGKKTGYGARIRLQHIYEQPYQRKSFIETFRSIWLSIWAPHYFTQDWFIFVMLKTYLVLCLLAVLFNSIPQFNGEQVTQLDCEIRTGGARASSPGAVRQFRFKEQDFPGI